MSSDSPYHPGIAVASSNIQLTAEKSGIAGLDYHFIQTDSLTSPLWSTNGFIILTNDASNLTVEYPTSGTNKFFLLQVIQNSDPTL